MIYENGNIYEVYSWFRALGSILKKMALVSKPWLMENHMKVIGCKTKSMEKANLTMNMEFMM